jgi:hypothetical protein
MLKPAADRATGCLTCAGRGALTLGTLHPLPTEPLQIPVLCMAGRLPEQNNAVVNLDLSAAPPAPGGLGTHQYILCWSVPGVHAMDRMSQ